MDNECKVSVFCLAYNHEKYIRKTLDGFVEQKTNFPFEVLIHDDASADNTKVIIEEYAARYPNIIKPLYQSENQFSKRIDIQKEFNIPRAKGKYIAFCEGDDYWKDQQKLQIMVDVLEGKSECSAIFHKVGVITENGDDTEESFPKAKWLKTGIVHKKIYMGLIAYTRTLYYLQFQLSGFMLRREHYLDYVQNEPQYVKLADVGDLPLFLFVGLKGNIYYVDKEMSCYRAGSIGSWNSRFNSGKEKRILHLKKECEMLKSFDEYSDYIVHEDVSKGIKNREFGICRIELDFKKMKGKEMKEFYKMLSVKERFKYHIIYYIPMLYRMKQKLTRNL